MKSKITFDFDENLKPIVKATISYETEDVRDKLAREFINRLGFKSNLCSIVQTNTNKLYSDYSITPQENIYETVILELCKIHPNREKEIMNFVNSLHENDCGSSLKM